jgi:hypothetical protein
MDGKDSTKKLREIDLILVVKQEIFKNGNL